MLYIMSKKELNNNKFWPCPNNCITWCRIDGMITNHHPNCEYVNESLIDVWKVSNGSSYYYTDNEAEAKEDSDECVITSRKMHREIYENLPEFDGF